MSVDESQVREFLKWFWPDWAHEDFDVKAKLPIVSIDQCVARLADGIREYNRCYPNAALPTPHFYAVDFTEELQKDNTGGTVLKCIVEAYRGRTGDFPPPGGDKQIA